MAYPHRFQQLVILLHLVIIEETAIAAHHLRVEETDLTKDAATLAPSPAHLLAEAEDVIHTLVPDLHAASPETDRIPVTDEATLADVAILVDAAHPVDAVILVDVVILVDAATPVIAVTLAVEAILEASLLSAVVDHLVAAGLFVAAEHLAVIDPLFVVIVDHLVVAEVTAYHLLHADDPFQDVNDIFNIACLFK